MTYYEKLIKLLGREPIEGSLEFNKKVLGLKSLEESAKSLFKGELNFPKQKNKAKKLGLL
jgi:hypothetical protein